MPRAKGMWTHLSRSNSSGQSLLAGLFVLLTFLEESLRDFDVLYYHCQNFARQR